MLFSGVIIDASTWQPYRRGNSLVEMRIVAFFFITQSRVCRCVAIIESSYYNYQENEKCMRDESLIRRLDGKSLPPIMRFRICLLISATKSRCIVYLS